MLWGLIREQSGGKYTETYVLECVEGEREDALGRLEAIVRQYVPERPSTGRRQLLFRKTDGFLLIVNGTWQSYNIRFTVAELLMDTTALPSADPQSQEESATLVKDTTAPTHGVVQPNPVEAVPGPPPPPSEEMYDDGIPLKPKWLGRTDLP
ncbi:hypothetical protein ACFP1Z_33215 [Streptomyces gamaensis]|uniref:Uncharacterized protein n=1 Tax=Streptomyces gamaensis TaxID=1763542 RepID=A0ABW0ZDG2_9ACTN